MILLLAWRNIWRNKARSLVIILSIALGLLAGISVLSLYKGMMKGRVRTVIDSELAHIQIHDPEFHKEMDPRFAIRDKAKLVDLIRQTPEVKLFAERSIVQGMLVATSGSAGVKINGIRTEEENGVSGLSKKIKEGTTFTEEKKNRIMVGQKLAKKMKLKKGMKVVLTFSDTSDNIVSAAFRICGIYQSENAPLDELNVYIEQQTLNNLLETPDATHEIAILLSKDEDMKSVMQKLKERFPTYSIESWEELSPETQFMVTTVDELSSIIIVIILIALAFGILNTMLMSVLERTKEIGMMVALGTSKLRIFFLILFETTFLTLVGSPVGILSGYFIINYYSKHGLDYSSMGKEVLESFGFSSIIYPEFPKEKLLMIIVMVILTAIVSCILPALKALRLEPVEALRK